MERRLFGKRGIKSKGDTRRQCSAKKLGAVKKLKRKACFTASAALCATDEAQAFRKRFFTAPVFNYLQFLLFVEFVEFVLFLLLLLPDALEFVLLEAFDFVLFEEFVLFLL